MTTYTLTKIDSADLIALKKAYVAHLPSPLDGMWECFVSMADHYCITSEDKVIGYCVLNSDHKLLQYSVEGGHDASMIFNQIINERKVVGAFVTTCEHLYLSLCMDHQKSVNVKALQYHFEQDATLRAVNFPPQSDFRLIEDPELAVAVGFGVKTLGADPDWLEGYFADLIKREALFGLWQGDNLMATGECRVSETQKPYADLGMVVSESHRRQGIASNILRQLLYQCRERGLRAICSTEFHNMAAQKAIVKAGFISHHRILDVLF